MAENKANKDMSMENFEDLPRPNPEGEIEKVTLEQEKPERMVKSAGDEADDVKVNLISLLRSHADVFAFSANEMPKLTQHSWFTC